MTDIAKRPPSLTKQIRTLLKHSKWPDGELFTDSYGAVVMPDGVMIRGGLGNVDQAKFIAAACNYFILEQQLERKAVEIVDGPVGQHMDTYRGAKKP